MRRAVLCSAALTLALIAVTITVLGPVGAGTVPASREDARLRFINASPDAPAFDVLVNGTPLFTDIGFGEITDYTSVGTDPYTITLRDADSHEAFPFLRPMTITALYPNATLAAAGMVTPSGEVSNFRGIIITDVIVPPPPDMVRGRFVHLVPDAPLPVSIVLEGETLFENVEFGDATPYVTVPAGRHELEVRVFGFPVAEDTITVEPDTVYSFFAIGLASGAPDPAILQIVDASFPHRIWLPLIKRDG